MPEPPLAAPLDVSLERDSPVPLYYQLARAIEHAIMVGDIAPGDRIENEIALTNRLGLSRPTTRRAIQELVNKGLLVRKRGVGTQVVKSQFRRDEKLSSLNDDLTRAGRTLTTRLLSHTVGPLDLDVRDASDAGSTETEFVQIRRLRLANKVPIAILTNYLPARFAVPEGDLRARGLYDCLTALGVHLKLAHQQVSARLMTAEEAELLDEPEPAAGLTVERLAYDDVGRFVEFGRHLYRPGYYTIEASLQV